MGEARNLEGRRRRQPVSAIARLYARIDMLALRGSVMNSGDSITSRHGQARRRRQQADRPRQAAMKRLISPASVAMPPKSLYREMLP